MLNAQGVEFFKSRHIDPELAISYGIYTADNAIAFPYFDCGEVEDKVVAVKYRSLSEKKFWQRKNGKKTFWNELALHERDLLSEEAEWAKLVITEGEIDALTALTCGYEAVSVPDGAPPPGSEFPERDDASGKFEFMFNHRVQLRLIKRFIIATDADAPGRKLAEELVRRLSPARCYFLTYPEGCKDLNEVLCRYGEVEVRRVLDEAKQYPVRGVYRFTDFPAQKLVTYETGWPTLDQHLRLFLGEFMVVSGLPGDGKTSFVLNLLYNMARIHHWRSAMFSPEMPVARLYEQFSSMGNNPAFIDEYFRIIGASPTGDDEDDFTLEWIIERAIDAVWRDNIKVLVIDPWNEVEHARPRDETMTDYIGRSIRRLKWFARQYGVVVIVVAHPTKEVCRDGKRRRASLYDVEGSAHWVNKADHGVIVERPDAHAPNASICVLKSRFEKEAGKPGDVRMLYDADTCRFTLLKG